MIKSGDDFEGAVWPPLPGMVELPLPRGASDKFKGAKGRLELEGHEGAEWFIQHVKDTAKLFFKQSQEVLPMVLVIASRDFQTCQLLPEPGIVACGIDPTIMNATETKDGLANRIRLVVQRTDAIGWAFMCESWLMVGKKPRSEMAESLEHEPGRKEIVMVSLQHRALEAADNEGVLNGVPGESVCRTLMFTAEIKRGSKGARLGDWQSPFDNHPGATTTGRFSNILVPISKQRIADEMLGMAAELFPNMNKADMIRSVTNMAEKMEPNDPRKHMLPWLIAKINELDLK